MTAVVRAVVLAMLALAGEAVGQEKADDQRIAELILQLGSDSQRSDARSQLLQLGSAAVPTLVESLSAEPTPKREVIQVLGTLGPAATGAFYPLLEVLKEGPIDLWPDAATAAAEIAPYRQDPVEETIQYVRSLTRRTEQGNSLLDGVQRAYNRFTARMRVEVDPRASIEDLLSQLGETDRFTKEVIVEILAQRSSEARPATQALASLLEEGDRGSGLSDFFLVEKASKLLVEIAPYDPRTWIAYKYMLEEGGTDGKRRAVEGLSRLGSPGAKKALPQLIWELRRTQDVATLREVITALGMIGPAAKDAIPTLEKLTEHEDPQIAERAKAALRQIRGT